MLRFGGAGVSDVGRVRSHNEDAAFMGPYVALVADGVGGAAAGEVASATVAHVISSLALHRIGRDPTQVLVEGLEASRNELARGVRDDVNRVGMATTLTAMLTDGGRLVVGHVGDSRAYRLRNGVLTQVTRDHTYVQQLIDRGELAPEEAHRHPWSNVVLRALGADPAQQRETLDIFDVDYQPRDRYLLCSDGLTDLVSPWRIAEVLGLADPLSAASRLVYDALEAGGKDNVTSVVFDVLNGPPVVGDGMPLGSLADPGNLVGAREVTLG